MRSTESQDTTKKYEGGMKFILSEMKGGADQYCGVKGGIFLGYRLEKLGVIEGSQLFEQTGAIRFSVWGRAPLSVGNSGELFNNSL